MNVISFVTSQSHKINFDSFDMYSLSKGKSVEIFTKIIDKRNTTPSLFKKVQNGKKPSKHLLSSKQRNRKQKTKTWTQKHKEKTKKERYSIERRGISKRDCVI